MYLAAAFAIGLLFGIGLILSGLTDPGKVLAFLDLAGAWDPSLLCTMGGATLVAWCWAAWCSASAGAWPGFAPGRRWPRWGPGWSNRCCSWRRWWPGWGCSRCSSGSGRAAGHNAKSTGS